MPRRAAATAHWRVSGVVGHTTATRLTTPRRSRSRARTRAGRVLPAPGAAETRNEPDSHDAIASSAATCHARSPLPAVMATALLIPDAASCVPRRTDRKGAAQRPERDGSAAGDVRVGLDLDHHPRLEQRGHLDERGRRADVPEDLAMRPADLLPARGVGHVDPRAHHVGRRRAGLLERGDQHLERAPRLVVGRQPLGRAAGDPDVRAGAHDARVADDRLPRRARPVALDQWRKCRRLVKTIATPASCAAATTSSSRTDPPGWMMARTPASIASAGPSANGKNASDARTVPSRLSTRAFSTASRTASTRLIWPAPMPIVARSRASTMALDFT